MNEAVRRVNEASAEAESLVEECESSTTSSYSSPTEGAKGGQEPNLAQEKKNARQVASRAGAKLESLLAELEGAREAADEFKHHIPNRIVKEHHDALKLIIKV